ncbi:hypothetical protein CDEST_12928 [Colletotrichum destructivum]|uniref:Uncharacterized protein n=1 Tax=Colletotrichum destructivum TaxID=34406 RepID=A0AAX4IX87_9PEZI|nr:hypothetical protein CDEST_12928 [Colletotrichum destructivum]
MHSQSIISVAIVALSFLGEASAYCNWNKKTIEDCCYRTNDTRVKQGGFLSSPEGTICPESYSQTCGADCCTWGSALGTACPK